MEAHYDQNINNNMDPRTHTRDTECVLSEFRTSFYEKIYHPHDCVRPDHKVVEDWDKNLRREHYGREVEIRNRDKEILNRK